MSSHRQGGVRRFAFWSIFALPHALVPAYAHAPDPLASRNDRPANVRILAFVQAVPDKFGKTFVKPNDRVATFDNDGTLCEQPIDVQFALLDQVKAA